MGDTRLDVSGEAAGVAYVTSMVSGQTDPKTLGSPQADIVAQPQPAHESPVRT